MLELFFSTLAIYIVYYIVNIRKFDKFGNAKTLRKEENTKKSKQEIRKINYMTLPVEVKYFIRKYDISLENINSKGLLKVVGLILGIDIAIITVIVAILIKNKILIQVVVGSILLIPTYIFSLSILAKHFKKKGLIKDERVKKSKRNRK